MRSIEPPRPLTEEERGWIMQVAVETSTARIRLLEAI